MSEKAPLSLSLQTARRLAISKQHLSGRPPRRPGPSAIMALMKDMRYLQLDPTNTVAPSHLLVLWSRLGSFRESDLDRLMWKEKKLFEYWAHVASVVLTDDYPLYLPRMKKFYEGDRVWDVRIRNWMSKNTKLRDYVLGELRSRGPLLLRDLEDRPEDAWRKARRRWGLKPSGWSNERSVSRMVEMLFHDGTLMVSGRQGRQKVYDLTERFLPSWTPKDELDQGQVEYLGAQLSLKALGAATPRQMVWHFLMRRYRHIKATIKSLAADGKVLPVRLTDGPRAKDQFFIHQDDLERAESITKGDWEPRTTLLSPFDNLIENRERTFNLFDFFYRSEIYTPKQKRKHGFFVLPILDGDKLIGRIDPAMDRAHERLNVNAVYAEAGAPEGKAAATRIADAIDDLAHFLEAKEVAYTSKVPEIWRSSLR